MDPPVGARGDGYMILNHIGYKNAASMYIKIELIPSLTIDHFEVFQIEKGNEAILDAIWKSYEETMAKVNVCLGKTITVGEKNKYKLFISKVGLVRDFIQAQEEGKQRLIDTFWTHTEVIKKWI